MTLPVPVLGLWPEKHIPFHSIPTVIRASVKSIKESLAHLIGGKISCVALLCHAGH